MSDLTDALADSPLASEGYEFAVDLAALDSGIVSEVWTPLVLPGGLVLETAVAYDSATLGGFAVAITVLQAGIAKDTWAVSRALTALASASASELWTASLSPSVLARGVANDLLSPTFSYQLTRGETGQATDHWEWANTAGWSDSALARDSVTYAYIGGLSIVERATAGEVLTPVRQTMASVIETATETTTLLDNYIYQALVAELAVARVGYMSPSGNSTAWAINLRNQALTEYRNFDFDSFVPMGRKYLGANRDGLYELNGDQDNTTNVIARIGGGYIQANAMKQSGLKGIYLALRSQGVSDRGNWFLKLIMGDGREMIYKATINPGLMVSKVNVGKGVRAGYMAWELQNADGQDFDFDKLEFVPMMSGRRVG